MSTHMASINISIKEDAYNFLSSLKSRNKSFSDVILEFKECKGNKENIMGLFGALKNIDWKKREKNMKEIRKEFNNRVEYTARLLKGAREK